jgi:transposase
MARGDLTDEQWERLAPLLPPEHSGKPGHPYVNHRRILNGILWIDRTGAPWRDLPERYGPFQTCFDRMVRWRRTGIWTKVLQALQADADQKSNVEWDGCAVDSSSIKAHPHAAGARHTPAKADAPKQEAEKRGSPRSRRSKKRPPGKSPKWLRKRWGAAEAD